jgi:PAS domain-containing protein
MMETDSGSGDNNLPADRNPDPEKLLSMAEYCGIAIAIIGALGVFSLVYDLSFFSGVILANKPLSFSDGLVWIVLGLLMYLIATRRVSGALHWGIALLLGAIAVLAALEFPLKVMGNHLLIEELLLRTGDLFARSPTTDVSPIVLFLIICISIALFTLLFATDNSRNNLRARHVAGSIGTSVFIIGFIIGLSYLYGTPFLQDNPLIPISPVSVIVVCIAGICLVGLAGRGAIPAVYFTGTSTRAQLLRTFIPLTLAAILIQNLIQTIVFTEIEIPGALTLALWFVFFSVVISYAVGRAASSVSRAIDVAEQERICAEGKLKQSEERLRTQYQNTPLALFTWQKTNDDFVLINCNQAAIEMSEGRASNLLGMAARELFTEQPEVQNVLMKCYSEKTVFSTDMISPKLLPGRYIHFTAAYIPPDMVLIYEEDITDRKNAEEYLRISREKLLEAQGIARIGSWEYDVESDRSQWSEEMFRIFERDPSLGEPAWEMCRTYIYQEDYDLVNSAVAQAIRHSVPYSLEFRIQPSGGSVKWVWIKGNVVLNSSQKTIRHFGTVQDITDRKLAGFALEQARRKLNLLNTITFQDIRGLVFATSAYIDLIKNSNDPQKTKDYLERENELVREISGCLDFTRNYQDLGIIPPRWQKMQDVLVYAISHLDFSDINKSIALDRLEVFADPLLEKAMIHVIQNIIGNEGKTTSVRIYSSESDDGITVYLEGNGVGIPVNEKEILFQHSCGGHRGLGLFLAREILSITGITIRETGTFGQGTRFELSVPFGSFRLDPQ